MFVSTFRKQFFGLVPKRFVHFSNVNYKIVKFKLFDIGEGISEVEIIHWNKKEGELVSEMESLLSVQSDKAAVEITSKYTGTLVKKYKQEKDIVKVGSYLCEIDTEDVVEEANGKEKEDEEVENTEHESTLDLDNKESRDQFSSKFSNKLIKASPKVKKEARERNIDLNNVSSLFNIEVITMEHLERYRKEVGTENARAKDHSSFKLDSSLEVTEVPLKGIKLAMCKSMKDSLSIPIFHLNDNYSMNNILKLKKEIEIHVQKKENIKITMTSLFIKLISLALKEYPMLNSRFNPENNTYFMMKNHNVCIAMDTPNGLMVPNIKNVEQKDLIQIQKDLNLLRERANQNKLMKDDLHNGSITISNFGTIAGSFATPIIFDSQACIIGISRLQKKILLKDDKTEITSIKDLDLVSTINFTFGADHRFVDGATIASFSKKLKYLIENPNKPFFFMK